MDHKQCAELELKVFNLIPSEGILLHELVYLSLDNSPFIDNKNYFDYTDVKLVVLYLKAAGAISIGDDGMILKKVESY